MSLWTKVRDIARPFIGGAIGGAIGGPIGAKIGSSLFAPRPAALMAPEPSFGDFSIGAMPGVGSESGSGGMVQTAGAVRGAVAAYAAARNWLISARGIVSTISGRLLGVLKGTKLIRNAQVADLAKRVGIEAAAVALGITAVEVAQLIAAHLMQQASRRKRGRGISGRDVRITRRTITKIRGIEQSLQGVCRARAPRRTRTLPAAFVRQG